MKIHCPICYESIIGETDFKTGFKEKYYKVNKHGRPICETCGYNKDSWFKLHRTLEAIILIVVLIGVIAIFIHASNIQISHIKAKSMRRFYENT